MFPANVRLDWKVIASTNTLAYLASSTVMKEKCFITLTPDHSKRLYMKLFQGFRQRCGHQGGGHEGRDLQPRQPHERAPPQEPPGVVSLIKLFLSVIYGFSK